MLSSGRREMAFYRVILDERTDWKKEIRVRRKAWEFRRIRFGDGFFSIRQEFIDLDLELEVLY
jgi:hypothetical protein